MQSPPPFKFCPSNSNTYRPLFLRTFSCLGSSHSSCQCAEDSLEVSYSSTFVRPQHLLCGIRTTSHLTRKWTAGKGGGGGMDVLPGCSVPYRVCLPPHCAALIYTKSVCPPTQEIIVNSILGFPTLCNLQTFLPYIHKTSTLTLFWKAISALSATMHVLKTLQN